jgi:hypothetical protein
MRPGKYGHRLTRDMYALPNKKSSIRIPAYMLTDELRALLAPRFEDAGLTIRSDEYCRQQRQDALENFDLNMALFAQIPHESFEDALTELLLKNKSLRPITDLRTLDDREGAYVMVLDDYRQAYIGPGRRRAPAHQIPLVRNQAVRPAHLGRCPRLGALD